MQNLKDKIPNWLTIFRIILIPILIISFYLEKGDVRIITAALFLIAAISDFFDGYLSRKWNVTSRLGAMLDPIADKLIVTSCLCLIITEESWLVLPAIAIICREIFISGMREYLGKTSDLEMPVTNLAKWKTTAQLASVTLLLLTSGIIAQPTVFTNIIYYLGCILFWVAAGLTLYTGYKYLAAVRAQNLL